MQDPKLFQQNWADEKPFFDFELPFGGLIVFDDADVGTVEREMINNYEEDQLLPMLRITDTEDPYLKSLELSKPPQFKDKKIQCVILPIRYNKVFKS